METIFKVASNTQALSIFSTLTDINKNIIKTQRTISTGKVINNSWDDPASYFISKKLNRDINSLSRKEKNIERGINLLQTNNTKFETLNDILLEMSDLANEANSSAVTSAEKQAIEQDLYQLRNEIEDILQSGISSSLYSGFTLGGLENVSLSGTGTNTLPTLAGLTLDGTNISVTGANVEAAISNIDTAFDLLLRDQELLGSYIRRLEFEEDILSSEGTDTETSLSTIQDADLAEQQLELSKLQILQQSTLLMLAQANANPQIVLTILKPEN